MSPESSSPGCNTVERERFKLCPNCGNFVGFAEKDVFCIVCGSKYIDECPACREPILYPISRFCPACGGRLMSPEVNGVTPKASSDR